MTEEELIKKYGTPTGIAKPKTVEQRLTQLEEEVGLIRTRLLQLKEELGRQIRNIYER